MNQQRNWRRGPATRSPTPEAGAPLHCWAPRGPPAPPLRTVLPVHYMSNKYTYKFKKRK